MPQWWHCAPKGWKNNKQNQEVEICSSQCSVCSVDGLDDLEGLFQPEQFYDSMILFRIPSKILLHNDGITRSWATGFL